MKDVSALPPLLRLHPVGEHLYEGEPEHGGENRNVVFGGQILAQMIVAAHPHRNEDRAGRQGGEVDRRDLRRPPVTTPGPSSTTWRGCTSSWPTLRQRHGDVLRDGKIMSRRLIPGAPTSPT